MVPHLVIVLPGQRYGVEGPALHIPVLALEEMGAETALIEYPTRLPEANETEWESAFRKSVATQVTSLLEGARPTKVTFLAKSLGTVVLASLEVTSQMTAQVQAIWVTPIFGQWPVRAGAVAHGWRSLLIAGGADPLHVPNHHEAVREALAADSLVLPNADHSLEVPGDVLATVDGLRALAQAVLAFARP
ncbi:MAG: hypothetical protein ACYCZN_03640 [Candidatus Dormibacteria bacterium]